MITGQLKKMGILPNGKGKEVASATGKPASRKMDFSNLPPLKSSGTVGFTNFRDTEPSGPTKSGKKSNGSAKLANGDDSDDEDDEDMKIAELDDVDEKDVKKLLSPEDSKFQGELAEGVNRIKVCYFFYSHKFRLLTYALQLKRQRSAEPESNTRQSPSTLASPNFNPTPSPDFDAPAAALAPLFNSSMFSGLSDSLDSSLVGSPMKKHRASVLGPEGETSTAGGLPSTDVIGAAEAGRLEPKTFGPTHSPPTHQTMDEDEEL